MPDAAFEIRKCASCGLRYPLVEGHPFGNRCPICMGETHRVLSRRLIREPASEELPLAPPRRVTEPGKALWAVLLDNIRSAWNVGSILRSADGFGFRHVYLCGITPAADHEAVAKTALGAQDTLPWSYHRDAERLVSGLKREGWKVWALEEDPRAADIESVAGQPASDQQTVLILGNEVTGVDPDLLDLCDRIVYIPMRGEKRSFNVAIAFSIAAYGLSNRRQA